MLWTLFALSIILFFKFSIMTSCELPEPWLIIASSFSKNLLELKICDNGNGFILSEKISGSNHINGIYNMQHRAKIIEAEFEIDSQIGKGTSITVTTPY